MFIIICYYLDEAFMTKDIRWIQRFSNYEKALEQFNDAICLFESRELSNLEKQGLIQSFEYTHELAWLTLRDFIKSKGNATLYGSKDASREAFSLGLIDDGDIWLDMVISRNLTSHSYDEERVNEIIDKIVFSYAEQFNLLSDTLNKLKEKES